MDSAARDLLRTNNPTSGTVSELRLALARASTGLWGVALFTGVVNVLMLTGPLFMLQVYDRVLASFSKPTLLVLFLIVVFLFGMMGILEHVRGRMLARIGAGFQAGLDDRVFSVVLRQAEVPRLRDRPAGALRDLAAIQSLLSSAGTGAAFDLPWAPLYLAVMFLFHPWLGWFGLAGMAVVLLLAILNQRRTQKPQAEAARLAAEADARTEAARKAIETVRGLGMTQALTDLWRTARAAALKASVAASDAGGGLGAATKAVRLLLQSAVLALGAWLVLLNELTAGAMIAASILLGRALAPVEQLVGHWPQFQRAIAAWKDLSKLLSSVPQDAPRMALPKPEAKLEVTDLIVVPPGEAQPTLKGVSFTASPGDAIAVIGPSASGKSTLARALAGVWPATRGEIRLGGADLPQYDRDTLGQWLGYLPQEVYLFAGTVAQNVSRFQPDAEPGAIIAAAQQAAAHELILSLPQGYDTVLTEGGGRISGGQHQRIGLARAFFQDPVVLILDEPNASLDDPGVQALNKAVANARSAGKIALVMSHRPSALAECNLVLVLDAGVMRGFGPRDDVLSRFVKNGPAVLAAQRGAV